MAKFNLHQAKKSIIFIIVLSSLMGCQSQLENTNSSDDFLPTLDSVTETTAPNNINNQPILENKKNQPKNNNLSQAPIQPRTEFMGLPVAVSSRFVVKADKREEFIKLATEATKQTRSEPGNLSYNVYEEVTYSNSFIFFEEWKSRGSLDKHLATPYAKSIVDQFSELVEGEPSLRIYYIERTEFRR
ncbi:MAG: antibiotic biosynthesis monooxygenase [Okeania sp. SIO3B5]|uniref:putative quinol monooxygenase n=1 Tax=Okeania sp. SIO3B5 TaxID=2607811 RepID=UPI0013FF8BE3|nr:putative quinol monooxygenase [Okeania sp. SIO3B5]NEO56701.1 antibiotic biosynthesis monooxygenase [Okeania sp. SIO3B5]